MTTEDRTAPGTVMAREIAEQPQVLARQLQEGLRAYRVVADELRRADPRFVLLAARGTSDHAALYAKYLLEITLGLPVGLVSPSTMTAYGSRPDLRDVLWVAVSQSGGSPDLVESTTVAAQGGALTVAVTNAPDSALARAARLHVDVLAGPERAVAATKSYTAQLLALWLLVDAWHGGDAGPAHVLPELAAQVLAAPDVLGVAERFRFASRVVTTGRGFSYPTAREAALKLMETSYLSAHAFSGADLLHGPLAMVDEAVPVIVVVPEGVAARLLVPVLDRLAELGADVCVVGEATAAPRASTVLALPSGVDEQLSPVLQILPLQRLAHLMAVGRQHDPDAPRGLLKVTRTW